MPDLLIRPALVRDCRDIARLFLVGSEDLAELIWSKEIEPGETVIEVGARRCSRTGVAFSYQSCVHAEREGRIIALLHVYPMEASAQPAVEMIEPVLRPFAPLRDIGSLYISALVVDPGYRGSGVGSRLLATAHQRASATGLPRLSVVLEQNEAALRFYRRPASSRLIAPCSLRTRPFPIGGAAPSFSLDPLRGGGQTGRTMPRSAPDHRSLPSRCRCRRSSMPTITSTI